eukprot:8505422-Heterocapsa_arctica.AAC.1
MHPTIQQISKARMYTRRTELQQIEHQKQEDIKSTDRHRQTLNGEEQTKQAHKQYPDKLGPEENVSRMRDCTARRARREKQNERWQI